MWDALGVLVLVAHYGLLLMLCLSGGHRLHLTWVAWRSPPAVTPPRLKQLPLITVQLPIYNERYVVERLIDAVAALDYPPELLQIQVLDDSNDDTTALAAALVAKHRARGVNIEHLHRSDRTGFKAGALAAGLQRARGEFVAIFDADFVPGPQALRAAIHSFADPGVGMVQMRWLHLNRDYSMLTRVQAVMLDAHFAVDQVARCARGLFFNFNGTAGLWRRQAIEDAGGWQWDTITEDLDLSYRAQLKGWRFVYLHQAGCPSELPVEMTSFKSQQHRWAQGAVQVMKKTLPSLWRSALPLRIKWEATVHLSSNLAYLLMLLHSAILLLPSVYVRQTWDQALPWWWLDVPLLLLATGSHLVYFLAGQRLSKAQWIPALPLLPALLAIAIGLSWNNGRAVCKGLRGLDSPFERTPKLGLHALQNLGLRARPRVYAQKGGGHAHAELALAALYGSYMILALSMGWWLLVPLLSVFMAGFLYSGSQSLLEGRLQWAAA